MVYYRVASALARLAAPPARQLLALKKPLQGQAWLLQPAGWAGWITGQAPLHTASRMRQKLNSAEHDAGDSDANIPEGYVTSDDKAGAGHGGDSGQTVGKKKRKNRSPMKRWRENKQKWEARKAAGEDAGEAPKRPKNPGRKERARVRKQKKLAKQAAGSDPTIPANPSAKAKASAVVIPPNNDTSDEEYSLAKETFVEEAHVEEPEIKSDPSLIGSEERIAQHLESEDDSIKTEDESIKTEDESIKTGEGSIHGNSGDGHVDRNTLPKAAETKAKEEPLN
ncbi:uncharacterized protein K452DRAFT_361310 [Aplosporella prunicola CBS 121167]|uniref:Uncharacterized protein n=1 Tax=Aplosporella prunicola CBS 121167 TaxID=1176127 RepID=A0A6A6B4A3_9PEZI|nr:uncharacterized protein K452DRAFT_361310 [Aplosporella prunicola CBS 121167]KAF2138223.1 hypothetical protein K452DRAFT_361310 [Aplosporella prunicola CBS 121167]